MQVELPGHNWQPRHYQRKLWSYLQNTPNSRAIEIAHRRWGKDDVALHNACIQAHERVGTYWHCLPEYAQARKAIWNAVDFHTGKRRIDMAFPPALRANTNEQEMFIRFKNGSTWQVVGSDRYNSLVGAGVGGVVFSEWALCNPSAWGYIRPMVEENDGSALFITTPRGRNHAKTMLDMAKKNSHRWFGEVSTIETTGALTQAQLDESLAEYVSLYGYDLGNAQFEQEYMCSFNAAIPGAYYAREMLNVRTEGRISDQVVAVADHGVHTVWDLGVTKGALAIWFFQVVGAQVFVLDVMVTGDLGIDQAKEEIDKRRARYGWKAGFDFVPHDAKVREIGAIKGRSRVETMKANGLRPQMVPAQTVDDGMNAVRQTLPFCAFHPRCEEVGIAALEQYRREWDDEKKTFRNRPVADWCSHPADAFRYLSLSWKLVEKAVKIIVKDKPSGTVVLPGAPKPSLSTRIKL